MNRRDPNGGSRQAGGYLDNDAQWTSPRQAEQWQGEQSHQAGGSWDTNEDRSGYGLDRSQQRRAPYPSSEKGRSVDISDYRDRTRRWPEDRDGYGYSDRDPERGYGRSNYRPYGDRDANFPRRDFDARGGNDFTEFTSQDYGGRDFSDRGGRLSGGMRSSESYRPSYGIGSWSRDRGYGNQRGGRDQGDFRDYDENRGFLQRAGDEVASWFGDDDAARRRELDHRGRGPSDYTRSDERIREDVNEVLTNDWQLDASKVRVTIKDREVTLEGTVSSRRDKRRAEDLADDVSGVKHVQNNLRIQEVTAAGSTTSNATSSGLPTGSTRTTG